MTEDKWIAVLTDDQAPTATRRQVIEKMRAALRGEDEILCKRALQIVVHVGMEAAILGEDLVRLWRAPNRAHFIHSLVNALARIREVPTLIETLRDGEQARRLRRDVPAALRGLGPAAAAAAPALVETLRDDEKRQEAIYALEAIGAAAVPALLAGLLDNSDLLRSRALRILGFIGPAARAALPAAVRALDDPKENVREQAVFALGRLRPLSEAAFAGLVRSLRDENRRVRHGAAAALRELGPDAVGATPALLSLLDMDNLDECLDANERINVLEILGTIGPGAGAAVQTLRGYLGVADGTVRVAAAVAMWRVSGVAVASVATLTAAAGDSNVEVRRGALSALGTIGDAGAAAGPTVVAALDDLDANVRTAAAQAAPKFRTASGTIVPALMRLLDDKDGGSRWQAIQSLLRMGVTDPQIGESIRLAMERGAWAHGWCSWDDGRCEEAVDLIRALGPGAASLVPTLEHLRDHYPQLRPQTIFALAHVRRDVAAAIPPLIAILADTEPPCPCQSAADYLGEIGPAAHNAVPHLARMARHGSNYYNRIAAFHALMRIDPTAADQIRESFS